jgi:DNA/RNA endonuclease YhcR with UshA esterase domain
LNSIRSRIATLLSAFLLGGCQAAPVSNSTPIREMSIEKARASTRGAAVRVTGIVTVQSGAFASSLSTGFAIQDRTAGIYVLDTEHAFELGDRVRVTGRRGMEFDQQNIRLESAEKPPGSGTVTPRPVQTGGVGEADEGYLIRAAGRIDRVEDDAPYGYKIFIDDGSGELQVFIDASIELIEDVAIWKPGDSIHVIGFAGRHEETHEIMPRIPSDLRKQAAD